MNALPSLELDKLARIETLESRCDEMAAAIMALSDYDEIHRSLKVSADVRMMAISSLAVVLRSWLTGMKEERQKLT